MATHIITPADLGDLTAAPTSTAAEILRNVAIILATRKGSIPMDRRLGIGWDLLDMPMPRARQKAVADVLDAIEYGEPRASVTDVYITRDPSEPCRAQIAVRLDLDGLDADEEALAQTMTQGEIDALNDRAAQRFLDVPDYTLLAFYTTSRGHLYEIDQDSGAEPAALLNAEGHLILTPAEGREDDLFQFTVSGHLEVTA